MVKRILSKLNGVFAAYKPAGVTTAALCNNIRDSVLRDIGVTPSGRKTQYLLKVGHGGTLDISAQGVVGVGIGKGCSWLPVLLHDDKMYRCYAVLGEATDTDDANPEGTVIERQPYDHVTMDLFISTLQKFEGHIMQKPPVFSALKHHGKRLSDMAREGLTLPNIKPRRVKAYKLQCTQFSPPNYTLEITSGGGFYVRSLVRDLGKALGSCSHVTGLERLSHGPFTLKACLHEADWTYANIAAATDKANHLHKQYFISRIQAHRMGFIR